MTPPSNTPSTSFDFLSVGNVRGSEHGHDAVARSEPTTQLRLCFVTTSLDVGGAESALVGLVAALAAEGHTVQVIALRGAGRLAQHLELTGVPTEVLNVRNVRTALSGLVRAIGLARRQQPHVIQGWMYHGNLFSSAIALACRARLFWGIRQSLAALELESAATNRLILVGARLSRWPSAIVYASRSARRDHQKLGYFPKRGAIVSNGVDLDRFKPDSAARSAWRMRLGLSSGTPLVGLVARLHPVKDHDTFLRAAARVSRHCPGVWFVLAGRGAELTNDVLMQRIGELGLRDQVAVLGEVDDVPGLMTALDVLCLSSRSEAFPNVLAEGMASELPCASTDVGDAAEIVGDTGELVPAGDAVALASAMLRLISLPSDERAALGRAARRRMAERFSLQACAANYLALYRACLERR